ncbi:MAG: acyl-CoA dehydrogenase family protein [Alphaproteobacteria bacterium]
MRKAGVPRAESRVGEPVMADLLTTAAAGLEAARDFAQRARRSLGALLGDGPKVDAAAFERHQYAAHGYAWAETYAAALSETLGWARRLEAAGRLGERERLILQAAFGEYLAQMEGGISLSQGEIARPADMGLGADDLRAFNAPPVQALIAGGNTSAVRQRLAELIAEGELGDDGLEDETLRVTAGQFRRFADSRVLPHAQAWHLQDSLVPLELIAEMGEMGVFGLSVPESAGGLGLGKVAMCIVTEELARASLAVGSLATRSEIAAELLVLFGTPEQRRRWLDGIVSGRVLPTAVFTEPDTGSDLASLKTRAERDGAFYRVTGNKIWITHAARADVMVLLARTDGADPGWRGLSMFFAAKPRGTDGDPFPAPGMSGSEIKVLGYRGMKEYEVAFDRFAVPTADLLGGVEGQGFKQLMATFESARIQTAARAVGVARAALELGLAYARDRVQFGKPILAYPRVAGKLAWMATETMVARQLTHAAARAKDSGRRSDIEAGMAKLLAARVAWANADNAVQIHGGNGYALEYAANRVLCDARLLSIFEGTAEIQANVIARGLLERRN